jgi:hypothetical protein
MTRDNLRASCMAKPMECEICKKFESIMHLMFECILSIILWDDVAEVFDIPVLKFRISCVKMAL